MIVEETLFIMNSVLHIISRILFYRLLCDPNKCIDYYRREKKRIKTITNFLFLPQHAVTSGMGHILRFKHGFQLCPVNP